MFSTAIQKKTTSQKEKRKHRKNSNVKIETQPVLHLNFDVLLDFVNDVRRGAPARDANLTCDTMLSSPSHILLRVHCHVHFGCIEHRLSAIWHFAQYLKNIQKHPWWAHVKVQAAPSTARPPHQGERETSASRI